MAMPRQRSLGSTNCDGWINELRHLDPRVTSTRALIAADRLREEVAQWQATHTTGTERVVETLQQLREGRDDELAGLR